MSKVSTLALAISFGMAAFSSQASVEISSLQGYFKTRATIDYVSDKMMQNKIDFLALDSVLSSDMDPSNSPQSMPSLPTMLSSSKYNDSQRDVLRQLHGQFAEKGMICKVADSGAEIVFVVDDSVASCQLDVKKINKAMAKTKDGKVVFFSQFGGKDYQQYYIDTYLVDGDKQTMSSSFLHTFKGQLIGDVTRVTRDDSESVATYDIEQYADYGPEDGQKIAFKSYQWMSQPLKADSSNVKDVAVSTFMVESGKANTFYDASTDGELKGVGTYWAVKDVVGVHKNAKNQDVIMADDVQSYRVLQSDTSKVHKGAYNSLEKGDWLDYNFNNMHDLTGVSPDSCMIKEISEGKPVIRYKGLHRSINKNSGGCAVSANDIKGKEKVVYTTFTTGAGKKISVKDAALVKSAKEILSIVENADKNASVRAAAKIDSAEFNKMKAQFDKKEKEFASFNSLSFWK